MLEIAEKLIASALGGPLMLTASLPRAGRATVRHQAAANRDVVHLLHAAPVLRGQFRGAGVQPIQDLIPLHGVAVTLAVPPGGEVRQARSAGRGPSVLAGERQNRLRGSRGDRPPDDRGAILGSRLIQVHQRMTMATAEAKLCASLS